MTLELYPVKLQHHHMSLFAPSLGYCWCVYISLHQAVPNTQHFLSPLPPRNLAVEVEGRSGARSSALKGLMSIMAARKPFRIQLSLIFSGHITSSNQT